jgi:hypothetical protein
MFGAKAAASLLTIQHSGDAGQVSEGICRLSVGLIFQQRRDLIAAWDIIGTLAQRGARNALIALRLPFEVRGYSLPRWSAGRRASLVDIDADVCGARDAPRFRSRRAFDVAALRSRCLVKLGHHLRSDATAAKLSMARLGCRSTESIA